MTLCPKVFSYPNFESLGQPIANYEDPGTIDEFRLTGGSIVLHEMFHVIGFSNSHFQLLLLFIYAITN